LRRHVTHAIVGALAEQPDDLLGGLSRMFSTQSPAPLPFPDGSLRIAGLTRLPAAIGKCRFAKAFSVRAPVRIRRAGGLLANPLG
jgi:hypothetical protein